MSELALIDQSATIDVRRWADTLVFAAQLAEKVSDTEFVPAVLRGRPEAVAATIMYGAEVGVTPMQALAGIHIVDGRPAPSAELMRAMILRAGHTFVIHEMTGKRVRVSGLRRGRPEIERVVVDWTEDMARAAGLLGRRNWQNYPRAMLLARATGDLARILFADVVKGLGYIAEDIGAAELDQWAPEAPSTSPDKPRRAIQRRPRRAAPVVADEPEDAQDAVPDVPPVAPPVDRAGAVVGDATAPAPKPPPVIDVPLPEQVAEMTPETVADALADVRVQINEQREHEYDDGDQTLPDELQPEQPQTEPPPGGAVRMISAQMLKALHAGLTRELGTVATREEKHALVAAILGHPVESTKDMTRSDAITVLAYMDRFATGESAWQLDLGSGAVTIVDTRTPPDEPGEPSE